MHRYAWPGNIRELENTLKSFSVLRDEESFFAKLRNQYATADSVSGLVPEHMAPLATGYSGEPIARLPLKEVTKMAARIKEYEIEKQYRELNRELAKGQMSPASAEASAWQGGRGRGSMGIKH
jgi:DNA-binding NtrC family response regulator